MPNLKRNSKVNECEQYKLDLTDYATGEMTFLTKEKQRRLFDHLRKCASCREMFFDYENIYSLLVTTAHVQKPEFIDRMNRLKEQFKRESVTCLPARQEGVPAIKPLPGGKVLDNQAEVGSVAGKVWSHLAKNGWVRVKDLSRILKRETKLHPDDTKIAIGWLAYEKKVYLAKKKQDTYVYLTEAERKIYQSQAQV